MLSSEIIYSRARAVLRQCPRARSMTELAEELGIRVEFTDHFQSLLGMYTVRWHNRIMLLSNSLEGPMLQMVAAHEIGHDSLHRDLARGGVLQEFTLFDMTGETEYEANAFAAHILIRDEDLEGCSGSDFDIVQMSQEFNVNVNLMLIKFREMNRLSHKKEFNIPWEPDSRFFAKTGYGKR